MSQITTHVLDTSSGKPAQGLRISLQSGDDDQQWNEIASGSTDNDGRISDLLPGDLVLEPGVYRMVFQTGDYFGQKDIPTFYPETAVVFSTTDSSHYHIPLLLSPYGYSTYRGS